MIKMIDVLMVLLFPLLDALPFTLPRYWISRDKLRIPFHCIVLLQLILSGIYSFIFYLINSLGYSAAAQWTTLIRYSFMLIFLFLAFMLIKDRFSKLMFTWLLFLAWQFFVLGNANFIESRFFLEFSEYHPYLVYNLARMIIYAITFPFLFHFFNHTVYNALKIEDDQMWRQFWKIPLFSTLFGMLYCTVTDIYAFASWQFLISRYLMLLGACYVSYVTLQVLEICRSRAQMEEALKFADLNMLSQKKQYDSLAKHMDEMKKARHDLRQHLTVVQSYLERDDKAGLAEYIDIYKNELPPDTLELYSQNDIVNAVVCYYAAAARNHKILFEASIDYPQNSPIPATDLTVLLGNLLENAVEACRRETSDPKRIQLRIKQRGTSILLIMVDNTCSIPIQFQNGIPLSSKRNGLGIGITSMKEIAARYKGTAEFTQKEGIFYASLFLDITSGTENNRNCD